MRTDGINRLDEYTYAVKHLIWVY